MRVFHMLLVAILAISGCSAETDSEEVNPSVDAEAESVDEQRPTFDRIAIVESLEIGQAYRGMLAQVSGLASMQGYFAPELRLIDDGRPDADGYIVLEFVARPPEATALNADLAPRRLVAALFVPAALAANAQGVRVLGAENSVARPF
ncbi:MAG: hypothetical protein AAGC92_16280 [Pseudomonadota bacterium]